MADSKDIGGSDLTRIQEEAAPLTIMEAALEEWHPPRKHEPPTILPLVRELQQDDVQAKGKGVQRDVESPSTLEESILRVAKSDRIVDLIVLRLAYLQESQDRSCRGLQHQPKDMEYAQKIEKLEESSSDEVISKQMNRVFLRQLLEDILDGQESSLQDAENGGISPDPALAALGAAPSCHGRGNADELFAPIPYQW